MYVCFIGVPVSSRVSAKIQQLVNTLKQPRRPPLREFFVDDFEELLEGECFFWSYSYKQTHIMMPDSQTKQSFESVVLNELVESISQIRCSKSANCKHCNEHQHLITCLDKNTSDE